MRRTEFVARGLAEGAAYFLAAFVAAYCVSRYLADRPASFSSLHFALLLAGIAAIVGLTRSCTRWGGSMERLLRAFFCVELGVAALASLLTTPGGPLWNGTWLVGHFVAVNLALGYAWQPKARLESPTA